MKTSVAILSVLACLALSSIHARADQVTASAADDDDPIVKSEMDWSDFDTSAAALNAKLAHDAQAALCSQSAHDTKPGDVVISYHRDAKGNCVGAMAVAK